MAPLLPAGTRIPEPRGGVRAACPAEARARLGAYLSAYWLRPENAYWMTLRSLALRTAGYHRYDADVCCGDGIFSFIHFGGRFAPSFDVFEAAGNLERVHSDAADMFDVAAEGYAPPMLVAAPLHAAHGLDLKENLLARARALGAHDCVRQCDANAPLPLADASIASLYCNSAYWIREIDAFLREIRRVIRSDGRAVLHVKTAAMRDYSLERFRGAFGETFAKLMGRGRFECWPTVGSPGEWERRFARAGLHVAAALPLATRTHAHVWDVGLRPIAPLLVRMTQALTPQTREAIKRDWLALFMDLLTPLCRLDFELFEGPADPAEIQYVLSR